MRRSKENILKVVCKHVDRVLPKDWSSGISDPRSDKGKVWNLKYVLEILLAGALTGSKTLRSLETLSEIYEERIPDTTMHSILVKLDAGSLKKQVAKGVKHALREHELPKEEFPVRITAIDGKALYTSDQSVGSESDPVGGAGKNALFRHMVLRAFYTSSATKLMLGQREIPCKKGESTEFIPFVEDLLKLYGNTDLLDVISVDAGMISKSNADALVAKGLRYIMSLKNPQQRLVDSAVELFQDKLPCCTEEEIYNGREVTRTLYRAIPVDKNGWDHLQEIWKIHTKSTNLKTEACEESVRYFVTNIDISTLSDTQVLEAVRMHWGIENNSNWCLDVNWFEDTAPWSSRALVFVSYIKMLAYNIISRLKTRRLRASEHREASWRDFFKYFEHALCNLRAALSLQNLATPAFI
jgi:predicted transposase YbfD/YdcC